MLRETFIHLPGVGKVTEEKLWRSGISDWVALRELFASTKPDLADEISRSVAALESRDLPYFFSGLPAEERWRTYLDFPGDYVALDIETTGLSIYDSITVIGIERDGLYQTFIRGSNLEDAVDVLESCRGLLTFNGTLFDLPFIRRTFPKVKFPVAHLDLRFLGRRVGLRGGLKRVEKAAGLRRPAEVQDLGGYAATVLWSRFEHGDLEALRLLIEYNAADVCVLRPLANIVTRRLIRGLLEKVRSERHRSTLFRVKWPRFTLGRLARAQPVVAPNVTVGRKHTHVNGARIPTPSVRWEGPTITLEPV